MEDVDNNDIGWGKYLRICVLVDLLKPLVKGMMVKFGETQTWVACKYECLPKFCFHCGVIQHRLSGCVKDSSQLFQDKPKQYGKWLPASSTFVLSSNMSASSQSPGLPVESLEKCSKMAGNKVVDDSDNARVSL